MGDYDYDYDFCYAKFHQCANLIFYFFKYMAFNGILSEETEQALTAIGVTSMTRSATSAAFSNVSGLIAARMDCTSGQMLLEKFKA
ncbi:hypothetical protein TNCV_390351 [Trichonephila clavipes]|nr:hypothetical protein TNCV_390351 [Trichonephila clavipes]